MKTLSSATEAAIGKVEQLPRDFLFVQPRNRATGQRIDWGAWSDVGTVSADVIDPLTGSTVSRTYEGAGELIEGSPVPLAIGLAVQTVTVRISQIAAASDQLIRTYDARFAPVEIHRGFLDPLTLELVAPATPRFRGIVDDVRVERAPDGDEGAIILTLASHTQELTRGETWKRSDADQRRRSATDTFFQHAATVGSWTIIWLND